jgi:lipid A 3-O-deacylase
MGNIKQILMLAAAAAVCMEARAAAWAPDGAFVEAGLAPSSSRSATVGAQWSWDWRARFGDAEATGFTDAYVSRWSARETITQVGVIPMVRLRMSHGRSPWFMEGGIGISMTDDLYRNHGKQFSTRFNFVDVFGIGRSLDAQQRRSISLRLAHVSNANLKKPNPGENILQLRYAAAF